VIVQKQEIVVASKVVIKETVGCRYKEEDKRKVIFCFSF